MNKILEKYSALLLIIFSLILSLIMALVMPNTLGLEGFIIFSVGFMSLIGLLRLTPDDKNISRNTYIVSLIVSVGLFIHICSLDLNVGEVRYEHSIEKTDKMYILHIDGYKLLYLNLDEIEYNDENPIKIFKFYKTDLFGFDLLQHTKVKSDLMNDYAIPKILK